MRTYNTFSLTEEAFLLNSLHEIVKIWASGTGKASFSLDVSDGKANLNLGIQLGHPDDHHPGAQPHPLFPHDQQDVVHPKPRRHKGPKRREKDRARAAAHQARLQSEVAAAVQDTAVPAVKLPFSGKLLPLKTKPSPAPSFQAATTPPLSSRLSPTTPKKLTSTSSEPTFKKYLDVSVVKKQLFPLQMSQQGVDEIPSTSQNYQEREKNLWTRLFET